MISLQDTTPSQGILMQYHAVFIYSDSSAYNSAVEWGNVLADYADDGGGVVFARLTDK